MPKRKNINADKRMQVNLKNNIKKKISSKIDIFFYRLNNYMSKLEYFSIFKQKRANYKNYLIGFM